MDRLITYLHLAHLIIKIGMDLITLWGQVRTDVSTPTYKVSVQNYPRPTLTHIRFSDHERLR
ncbi:hypothetical protein A0J51_03277 [Gluconobacter japonicus]|nr:hypothetical protein A0J51_03277 [Gluconobacter japonicus]